MPSVAQDTSENENRESESVRSTKLTPLQNVQDRMPHKQRRTAQRPPNAGLQEDHSASDNCTSAHRRRGQSEALRKLPRASAFGVARIEAPEVEMLNDRCCRP